MSHKAVVYNPISLDSILAAASLRLKYPSLEALPVLTASDIYKLKLDKSSSVFCVGVDYLDSFNCYNLASQCRRLIVVHNQYKALAGFAHDLGFGNTSNASKLFKKSRMTIIVGSSSNSVTELVANSFKIEPAKRLGKILNKEDFFSKLLAKAYESYPADLSFWASAIRSQDYLSDKELDIGNHIERYCSQQLNNVAVTLAPARIHVRYWNCYNGVAANVLVTTIEDSANQLWQATDKLDFVMCWGAIGRQITCAITTENESLHQDLMHKHIAIRVGNCSKVNVSAEYLFNHWL